MTIDWSATGAMISGWGSWASALAVGYAAYKAADTFDSWKLRRTTEREEEVAQRVLVAVFKAKEAYRFIRFSTLHAPELAAAQQAQAELDAWPALTAQQQKRLTIGQVYIDRINSSEETFRELAECIPVARAIFGHDLGEALGDLHRQLWVIRMSAEAFAANEGDDPALTRGINTELNDHALVGEGIITGAIKASIETIEMACLPVLRPDWRR